MSIKRLQERWASTGTATEYPAERDSSLPDALCDVLISTTCLSNRSLNPPHLVTLELHRRQPHRRPINSHSRHARLRPQPPSFRIRVSLGRCIADRHERRPRGRTDATGGPPDHRLLLEEGGVPELHPDVGDVGLVDDVAVDAGSVPVMAQPASRQYGAGFDRSRRAYQCRLIDISKPDWMTEFRASSHMSAGENL